MVKRLTFAALLFAGCFPPALDESGKRCAFDRPCGDGFSCFDFTCQPNNAIDAGPDNWLVNPGFETLNDAGRNIVSWRVVNGDLDPEKQLPYEGKISARISTADGGETPSLTPSVAPVRNTLAGQTWCTRAWVRTEGAGDAGLTVGLSLRERHDDGGINESTPSRPRVYREWLLLEEQFITEGAERLEVRVAFGRQGRKGEVLLVDETQLKRSIDGTCRW